MAAEDAGEDLNKNTGNTFNIDIRSGGTITIGDGANLYTNLPNLGTGVPEDSDHIYDVPRKVISSNQGQSTVTFPTKNDRPECGLTRHVGFEERYQRGHHHQQQQQYVEDPVNRVPNDHQLSRWHNLNPTPGKGTFVDTGDTRKLNQSDDFILSNVEQLVRELDHTNGPQWQEKEQSILQGVEKSLQTSCLNRIAVYQALAKMSCSRSSSKVVSYALRQLDCLIRSDGLESGKNNFLGVEKIVRLSISSPDAVFKEEDYSGRELRLSVYSRILASLIIQQTAQGTVLAVDDMKSEWMEFQSYLRKYYNQTKDCYRYCFEFIQKAISYLLKPTKKLTESKVKAFLNECQEKIEAQSDEFKELSFLDMLKNRKVVDLKNTNKKKFKSFALHCVILCLQRKVHCSGNDSAERRAVLLLLSVIEAYKEGGGGSDWKFCLLAGSVLSDIAMNNDIEENRTKAGNCLVSLLIDKKVRKEQICRAIVERLSSQVLFSPDSSIRELLVPQFCQGENSCFTYPEHLHTELVVARQQLLQINNTTISQSSRFFVKEGVFHGNKVAVKVMYVTNQNIMLKQPLEGLQTKQRLIQEAYFLEQLQRLNHQYFPVLLSYNTASLPYHLITRHECFGNLLQLLQESRGNRSLPVALLLRMMIDIAQALQFLQKLGMVHRAVMADNVLVGDSHVCKLSGLHSLLEITGKPLSKTEDSHTDLPMRWEGPEVLMERRYSTASDVWSFGILMYEMLTYGCHPYSHFLDDHDVYCYVVERKQILPHESCFEVDEYELMKQCWKWRRSERIILPMLTAKLRSLYSAVNTSEGGKSRPSPPPLKPHITKELTDLREPDYSHYSHFSQLQGSFSDDSCYSITVEKDGLLVKETIKSGDKLHQKRLLDLSHPNLDINLEIGKSDGPFRIMEMISVVTDLGNLKEYVLNGNCQEWTIVAFLSQIASALHHLHEQHIVHGELRAEHVNVVEPNKIQIVRLGRSKSLVKRPDEDTSKACVVSAVMPPDSTRWSAPEVILQKNHSHASDVWSFGVVAWELFAALTHGVKSQDKTLPYVDLSYDEILPSIQKNGNYKLLCRPESCPDWIYIMIRQCWAYHPKQRPPAIALLDCLTARKPMQSWLMKLWLKNHNKPEQRPDLSICQPEDAFHVTKEDDHPSRDDITKMCSDGFFTEHEYQYVSIQSYSEIPVSKHKPKNTSNDDHTRMGTESPVAASGLNRTDDYEPLLDVRVDVKTKTQPLSAQRSLRPAVKDTNVPCKTKLSGGYATNKSRSSRPLPQIPPTSDIKRPPVQIPRDICF